MSNTSLTERTNQVREQVAPVAADLKVAAADYASTAKEWAGPRIEAGLEAAREQRKNLGPALEQAKGKVAEDIAPKVAAAVGAAIAASEPVRKEAAARGHAAALALKGDLAVPRPKRRVGRKLFVLVLLATGAAVVWAALRQRRSDPWAMPVETSSPPPAPAPVPAPPPTPEAPAPADAPPPSDAGGAGPDEAISDEVGAPAEEKPGG